MVRINPAKRDENDIATLLGVSSTDSFTPIMARVDPVTNYLLVDFSSSSNSATLRTWNKRDENDVPTMYGISDTDGVTLIPIRTDSQGRLLIQFT